MDPEKRKKMMIGIALGCGLFVLVVVALILWRLGTYRGEKTPATSSSNQALAGMNDVMWNNDVYTIALARAVLWKPDALMTTMATQDATGQIWTFDFVSKNAPGNAFAVTVNGQTIVSANEISASGDGAALPQNVIAPTQAIAAVRAVPGYASADIVSVKASYDAPAQQWYWGMKTAGGVTVAIKATP